MKVDCFIQMFDCFTFYSEREESPKSCYQNQSMEEYQEPLTLEVSQYPQRRLKQNCSSAQHPGLDTPCTRNP